MNYLKRLPCNVTGINRRCLQCKGNRSIIISANKYKPGSISDLAPATSKMFYEDVAISEEQVGEV